MLPLAALPSQFRERVVSVSAKTRSSGPCKARTTVVGSDVVTDPVEPDRARKRAQLSNRCCPGGERQCTLQAPARSAKSPPVRFPARKGDQRASQQQQGQKVEVCGRPRSGARSNGRRVIPFAAARRRRAHPDGRPADRPSNEKEEAEGSKRRIRKRTAYSPLKQTIFPFPTPLPSRRAATDNQSQATSAARTNRPARSPTPAAGHALAASPLSPPPARRPALGRPLCIPRRAQPDHSSVPTGPPSYIWSERPSIRRSFSLSIPSTITTTTTTSQLRAMTAFYAQQPFSPFGPSTSSFSAPDLLGLPPALPAHLRQPQASTSSSTPSSSASSFAPALFSPSLFAPSPLSPSAGPTDGSYFTALPDSMAYSYGLLQSNQAGAFFGQQLPAFAPQHQQQPARLTVVEDETSFWSTSPPPPASRQTASLFEFESAGRPTSTAEAAAALAAAERADSASSSSFSVHTPTGSEDGAFDDLRAVDESERGDLSLLLDPVKTTSVRMERAGSEHSDGAVRSADGKGYVSRSIVPMLCSDLCD